YVATHQDKTRNALLKSLEAAFQAWLEELCADQDCHDKAWGAVQSFLDMHLRIFTGRSLDADSTLMPQALQWLRQVFEDMPRCTSDEDHCVVVWLNAPSAGIVPVAKWEFFISAFANILPLFRRNSIGIIVHPNRAAQTGNKTLSLHFYRVWGARWL
ncbi:unnamed protein product, partial [Effrenium voratum]